MFSETGVFLHLCRAALFMFYEVVYGKLPGKLQKFMVFPMVDLWGNATSLQNTTGSHTNRL